MKRYNIYAESKPTCSLGGLKVVADNNGKWVEYVDYKAEVVQLRDTIVRLEKYHNEVVKSLLGV